jgi:hypothetical protein
MSLRFTHSRFYGDSKHALNIGAAQLTQQSDSTALESIVTSASEVPGAGGFGTQPSHGW